MNDERNALIWGEIQAVLREVNPEKLDGEKTINELCEEWGIGRSRARTIIERLVKNDVLLRRGSRLIYLRPNPEVKDIQRVIREALM